MTYINRPIHPFLRFIYFLLRIMAWLGVSGFYRRRLVIGAAYARLDGPAIIISNHPSTLMDVLNVCLLIRQEPYFLANYGLFKHPVSNWILTRLFCIPIKRKEDVEAGESRNNDAAFEACFTHLKRNGLLYIAPEGVSWMHRWVRPFKTGTARIALGAEKYNNWALNVKILPVGVSYDHPNLFRSQVTVHYGEPVLAALWKEKFLENEETAVDELTLELENRVRALSIDVRDEAGEQAQEVAEMLLYNEGQAYDAPFHHRAKNLAESIAANAAAKAQFVTYQKTLQTVMLSDQGIKNVGTSQFGRLAALIAGAPFFLIGYCFWFIPCYLPAALARRMKLYIGYDSNVKTLAGLFTFAFALGMANWSMRHMGLEWHWRLSGLSVIIALGYFSEWYQRTWQKWRAVAVARAHRRAAPDSFADLNKQRESLLSFISSQE